MSKIQRTPPGNKGLQISSESDITNLDPEIPLNYLSKRMKRSRNDDHSTSEENIPRDELLSLLTQWKKEQDKVIDKLFLDIAELKKQNACIQSSSSEVEKSMQFLSKQYDELKNKLLEMEQERMENKRYISSLESQIDDMQKRLKFTVVEVRNLPVAPAAVQQNRQETQQDLTDLMLKTCGALNVDISTSDIKDIYRIKNKIGSSVVVTELNSVITKNKILNGVKDYNKINPHNKLSSSSVGLAGSCVPIYVTESLTNKDRKLFGQARDTAKTLGYRFCWTSRGRIYMRLADGSPRLQIKTEADLRGLKNNA
ncbi:uncharacterized protein LOC106143184 [Amyelois transitella]|uniref:uncharacterized protein LOC106143184 n=1 Tax=Amyelois transitella TaxID=680683 RepID=UPI00067BD907|nr:uncharacterized protein LOC106143184 [Amyelois transitella]